MSCVTYLALTTSFGVMYFPQMRFHKGYIYIYTKANEWDKPVFIGIGVEGECKQKLTVKWYGEFKCSLIFLRIFSFSEVIREDFH